MPPRNRLATLPDIDVVGVPWDQFLAWFGSVWEQGQHIAIIGPTGCGKTTAAVGIARLRNWVLCLDAKGGDSTLDRSGFTRVTDWPLPRKIRRDLEEQKPVRLVAGFGLEKLTDRHKLKSFLDRILSEAWLDGGWTIEIDELQIMADRKMMSLGGLVEEYLVAARDKGLSTITAFQAPAWVPTASTRQATYIMVFRTKDETVIKALAAKVGRSWRDLQTVVANIPKYHFLLFTDDQWDPIVVSCPAKV